MSTFKNVMKYIGIFLGICLAVLLVILGSMVLFKFQLFGYKYVKITSSDADIINVTKTNGYDAPVPFAEKIELIDRITVKADNIDVVVKPWTNGDVNSTGNYAIVPNIQAQGFAKVDERGTALKIKVTLEKYTIDGDPNDHYEIIVDASCPSGWVHYGSSTIYIKTPYLTQKIFNSKDDNDEKYYSDAEGKFGANETFDVLAGLYTVEEKDELIVERVNTMHLKKVNIETTTGNITITDALIGANNEINAKAKLYIDQLTTKTTSGQLKLHRCGVTHLNATSDTGDMSFDQLTNYTIPGNVTLSNNRGKVYFAKGINLGYGTSGTKYENKSVIKLNGQLCQVELSSLVNANLEYIGDADFITIGSIIHSTVQVNSVNAHIKVGSIYSDGYIHLSYNEQMQNTSTRGNRTIEINYIECSNNFGLSTWDKPITINKLINKNIDPHSSTLITNNGNITINELIGNTDFITKGGNITVKQRNVYNNEIDTLAEDTATQRNSEHLNAKKQLLEDFKALILEAKKSNDRDYASELSKETNNIQDQIDDIQNTIAKETIALQGGGTLDGEVIPKDPMLVAEGANDIQELYNGYLRERTQISTKTYSGTVTLTNLVTNKVDAIVLNNDKATMYIQMLEFSNSQSRINIISGVGNTYLYTPNDTITTTYWVYAKEGVVKHNNAIFFGDNDLQPGKCRCAIAVTGDPYTDTTYTVIDDPLLSTDTNKTIDQILELDNFGLITIQSGGGETVLNETSSYRA